MSKRIKSFFITASSIAFTAFVGVVLTPEWGGFLTWIHDQAAAFGIPAAIVAVVGVFISEVWKQILNNRKIAKTKDLYGVAAIPKNGHGVELY